MCHRAQLQENRRHRLDSHSFQHHIFRQHLGYSASGTLYDSSGHNNGGTQSGGVTYGAAGKVRTALTFDRINDYVTVSNVAVNTASGNNNTAIFWIKWDGSASTTMPFSFSSLYDLMINGSKLGFNTACSDNFGIAFTAGQYANNWTQIAAVFRNNDSLQSQLFINGVQQSLSLSGSVCTNKAASANMLFGAWGGPAYFFGGSLDDVRIYNRALSASEISALYNSTR